ncbi:PadR family transcriptional regulator [Companilactobacillus bobalius]|uniref:Transcription regulator PadR N-terminal domain-containing protein n=2 Tax=Companilactobacillus bobalius TaxID=2801451 RepID=A0A202F5U6_9LACO|nr:PadR family transcriptional regulator [Companilactobacillus bobalius]KAE9560727.1 hypothetical protein ATN92_11380 [Companilactobacillus bobalius]KRK85072.1 transcription regulator [Companilactobacillus bobalius DSM 19674]OVE95866.1 hypothetical protein LKACC16343_02619 [Companilactobacillus bobalius]GEO59504.1 PadR family transcriptional regulator [Companilactobacillus paralimentarius]
MYDLFVLGQLMDESMSGYLMRQILQQIVGRQRKISFGMIYPLFKRLNEAGYITLNDQVDVGKRSKKVATITDRGRIRFKELMIQKVPLNPNLEFTYSVKFRNFHQIEPELRREILNEYKNYLLENQKSLSQQIVDMKETPISAPDLKNAQWVISLKQVQMKAALQWVDSSLKKFAE